MKSNGKYKANNDDTLMVWYWQFREERTLPFPKIGNNSLPPHLQANIEAVMSIQEYGKYHLDDLY